MQQIKFFRRQIEDFDDYNVLEREVNDFIKESGYNVLSSQVFPLIKNNRLRLVVAILFDDKECS